MNEHQSFLLHMKISVRYIVRSKQTSLLRRLRAFVRHCIAENHKGNPDYTPLRDVVRGKFRPMMGPDNWTKTTYILHEFCAARHVILTE